MNALTQEWIDRAEGDYLMAQLAMSAGDTPIPEGVCFHAQQCAEKYLKAYLQEQFVEFPFRHQLMPLLDLCLPFDPRFGDLRAMLSELDGYAVATRYPGLTISLEMAISALDSAQRVRQFIRGNLLADA